MATRNKIIESNIDQLIPDDCNANKGTQFGQHLIEESLRKFGAGRSILLDRNNRILAGNKTIENAANIGLEKVLIIETTGQEIIAVKRTDIDLDSQKGRELALADNATAKANITWDEENISKIQHEWDVNITSWTGEEIGEKAEEFKKRTENLRPFCTNHILISYPIEQHEKIMQCISALYQDSEIEIESSANG